MEIKEKRMILVVEITKEEIEKSQIVTDYTDFIAKSYNDGKKEGIIFDYVIQLYEESEEAMLRITSNIVGKEDEDSLFIHHVIPFELLFNDINGCGGIKFDVKNVCSDADKELIDTILEADEDESIDNDGDTVEFDVEDKEINSWFMELEFSKKDYINLAQFIVPLYQKKILKENEEKITDK